MGALAQQGADIDPDALARRLAAVEVRSNSDYLGAFAWTSLPAAASYAGYRARVTDRGYYALSDGVNWNAIYNPSSVAITGGTIAGCVAVGPYVTHNGANRLNYRKAFAKVLAGQRARVLIYGDSTTMGAGAGTNSAGTSGLVGARALNWPTKLATELTAMGIPAWNEGIMGDQAVSLTSETYTSYDPRLVLSGGFAFTGLGTIGSRAWQASATGAKWAFTPAMTFDRFDVYTFSNPGSGSLTVDVDGGSALTTISTNAAQSVQKTTVTCTRGTHTINLTTTSTSGTTVIGVIPWDSTIGGLDIVQGAIYGGQIAQLATATSPWNTSSPVLLGAIAPDIAIVQMTVNDANNGTGVASYTASLAALESALATAGAEPLLMTGLLTSNAATTNGQLASLVAAVQARAGSQSRVLADLGARCGSYAAMNAAGFMYTDGTHGTALMYADEGRWMAQTLLAEIQ